MTSAGAIVQVEGTRNIKVHRPEMISAGTIIQVSGTRGIKMPEKK